ncbi:MAG: class I SAM-dependent methyltransferase [Oscillospiraceae bacterium]|nr:class I SAM-dependent methyltransferase [Oscillospiraceae bacterium]
MKEEEIRKRDVLDKYLSMVHEDSHRIFKTEMFETTTCPACFSSATHFEFEKLGFSYCSCDKCQTLFVNPRPTLDSLEEFYSNSPSTNFWVEEFFLPVAEVRREKIFKPRAQFVSKQFPTMDKAKIGDIGAGFGLFLEELRKIWPESEIIAVEPSDKMANMCVGKGIKVFPKMLENLDPVTEGDFELLVAYELFEHLLNPASFLQNVYDLLKPNGYFVLTTLNGMGFDIQLLWEKSKSVSPPHHLNFFNPKSISLLLQSKGFEAVNVETPGTLDWDIVEGMYLNEGVHLGRFWEGLVGAEDKTKNELQQWLSNNKLSSHMRVIAKRK